MNIYCSNLLKFYRKRKKLSNFSAFNCFNTKELSSYYLALLSHERNILKEVTTSEKNSCQNFGASQKMPDLAYSVENKFLNLLELTQSFFEFFRIPPKNKLR